jgi:hypothetical protein
LLKFLLGSTRQCHVVCVPPDPQLAIVLGAVVVALIRLVTSSVSSPRNQLKIKQKKFRGKFPCHQPTRDHTGATPGQVSRFFFIFSVSLYQSIGGIHCPGERPRPVLEMNSFLHLRSGRYPPSHQQVAAVTQFAALEHSVIRVRSLKRNLNSKKSQKLEKLSDPIKICSSTHVNT